MPRLRGHWFFFILGIPGVIGGWARWDPKWNLNTVGFVSSVFLVVMGAIIYWWERSSAGRAAASARQRSARLPNDSRA